MHLLELTKADGRMLRLYGREPVTAVSRGHASPPGPSSSNPQLRWHPLRGEWVTYAPHRQGRTFLPPPEYNPLRPSNDPAIPTELPTGHYDVAVFDNLFPSLSATASVPAETIVPTSAAIGHCEVIVYSQDESASLGSLPLDHLELLLEVWGLHTQRNGADPRIRYVLPFENRGREVGATLAHPHGQIYSYSFVPPLPLRMLERAIDHYAKTSRSLLGDLIDDEIKDGKRMLYVGEHAVAFVPVCARYSYEVWVAPRRAVPYLSELTGVERADLARALKTVLSKFDLLWQRPFPYVMAWFQAPTDGESHPESHVHLEFYPAYRTRDKLKFLAGTELAGGLFACDSLPEEGARQLQDVVVTLA